MQVHLVRFGVFIVMLSMVACTAPAPLTNPQGTPLPPVPTLDGTQVNRGRQVYQANCGSCHGAKAEGAPNWKKPDAQGNYPPPPHDDSGHTWHHSDRVLYEIMRDGFRDPLRPDAPLNMPAFGSKLSDADLRAVIVYFKSLWSREHREFQWERIVEDFSP
ncbi:MAG: cytochrome c [Chloroflexi bacterium]|nr:cytochrome c [Chloroflexota bacterium]